MLEDARSVYTFLQQVNQNSKPKKDEQAMLHQTQGFENQIKEREQVKSDNRKSERIREKKRIKHNYQIEI